MDVALKVAARFQAAVEERYTRKLIASVHNFRKVANLIDWAKRELETAGLFDADSDYNGALGPAILEMVKTFSEQGHSGGSAGIVRAILDKLLNWEPLTPVVDPLKDGYEDISTMWGDDGVHFQCTRDSTIFSDDSGKSWYKLVDDLYKDEDGSSYSKARCVPLDAYNKGEGHSVDYRPKTIEPKIDLPIIANTKTASGMLSSEAFKLLLKCVEALTNPRNFLEPDQIKQLVAKEADLVKFLFKPSQHPDRVFKAFANINIPRKLWIGLSLNESLDTLNVHFKNLYDHKGQDLYLPLKSGVEKDCLEAFHKFAEQTKLARLEGRELVPLEIFSELVDSISSVKGQLKGLDIMERWLDSMKHRCIPPEDVQKWLDGYKSKVVNMKNMLVDSARIVKQRTATVSEERVLSRFEEGKPADPTENMSPEDAKKWWEEHAKNRDNFKASSVRVAVRYLTADQDKTAPSKVDKYFKSVKEKNPSYTDAQAWATAWSIYCRSNPGSSSCHQDEYFKGKSASVHNAGWSSAIDIMSVLFVEGRKPVPFNIDTIKEINQTFIPVIGDDGEEHEANLNVIGHQYSGPLTYQQEKMGMRRETRVDIQYSVDEGGSPKSSERTAFAALAQLGKRMGFKVEPVHHGYKPQTRKI